MLPWNELTMRVAPAGGPVASAVCEATPSFPHGHRRVILLVHGYNNTEDQAREGYDQFTDGLADLGPAAQALLVDLGKLYWPGDAGLGPVSFASYPVEIEPAVESAQRLADYLATLEGPGETPIDIYLVGHSLGNRVILELLDRLAATPLPLGHVTGACLMAAAVPVEMVEDGRLRPGATLPTRTLALFSHDDEVLHWAFPLGESLAGEGFFPTAVGRSGGPPGVWTEREELFGNHHGSYWNDRRAAVRVARLLGVAVPVQIEPAPIVGRELPSPAGLLGRTIDGRVLPVREV